MSPRIPGGYPPIIGPPPGPLKAPAAAREGAWLGPCNRRAGRAILASRAIDGRRAKGIEMVKRMPIGWAGIIGMILVGASPARADEPPKPATVKVTKGPFRVATSLKGVVESDRMDEVAINPEAFELPLAVEKAAEQGTVVKKGDVLIELDLSKIDQAIKDLKVENALTEVALKHADRELPVLEKLQPLDLVVAERAQARAAEDLARFLEIDKPLAILGVAFNQKSSEYSVASAEEELAQLEKMYRDKDLTEETERFILRRNRFAVEMAKYQLKVTAQQNEQTLKVDLPRREVAAVEDAERQKLALDRSKALMPLELGQKRLNRDKLAFEQVKNVEKLSRLERDRQAMTIRSPADGIVYLGKCSRGQWATAAAVAPRLTRGGVIAPKEVVVTVVGPRPAFLRAAVEEKDLEAVHPGAEGKASPVGYPDLKFTAKVESLATIAQSPGQFDARVALDLGTGASAVLPGMACTLRLVAKRDALTVPEAAVFADDPDEPRFVVLPGGAKRPVVAGKAANGRVEILEGLAEGDEIQATR